MSRFFLPKSAKRFGLCDYPVFTIGGSVIEYVDEYPHLGHLITCNLNDEADIAQRRFTMIGQINSVLCYFGKLDKIIKSQLLKIYCSSFYGCELWDLWNPYLEKFLLFMASGS